METNKYYHLGPRAFIIFVLRRAGPALFFIILGLLLIFIDYFTAGIEEISQYKNLLQAGVIFSIGLFGVLGAVGFIIAWIEYYRFRIMLSDDTFWIKRGVLTLHKISIPYSRIERVNLREPLLFQILGVSVMDIQLIYDYEGGDKSASDDEILPAIDKNMAHHIQSQLTNRVAMQKMHIKDPEQE